MTNALRSRGLHLKLVKGPTDESEILIRLADRWAGCLRQALSQHNKDCEELVSGAQKKGLLKDFELRNSTTPPFSTQHKQPQFSEV